MFCVPTSPFISKSVITSRLSPVLARRLYALYKLALYIVLAVLNLILNCLSLEFAIAVYRGLLTRRPLLYVLYVPYIPVWSGNIV